MPIVMKLPNKMNMHKKITFAPIVIIALLSLCVSCFKKTQEIKQTSVIEPDQENYFKVDRIGQIVQIQWKVDVSNLRRIDIFRNTTGIVSNRVRIAELDPKLISFEEMLPDHNAYWYWLQLITKDNKRMDISPIRVPPDNDTAKTYIKQNEKFKVSVSRTDDVATLKWDFPKDDYKIINVSRYTTVTTAANNSKKYAAFSSLDWSSQYQDALPSPNSEYWYWFEIIYKSGKILYQGPVKADYAE